MRLYFNQITPNIVSKASVNNNVTIIPKIIKNEEPTSSNTYIPWTNTCSIKKYNFHANPIRHYRKQYVNNNATTFSNLSLIGNLDKPGANIVTKVNSPSINTANTNLSNNYASSHREYLYNKNKTFNQNLPLLSDETNINNGEITTTTHNGEQVCTTFNPSNKKFQCQGPVSSSARISSLKYDCDTSVHCKKTYINNKYINDPLSKTKVSPLCLGCVTDTSKIRRKRINILK